MTLLIKICYTTKTYIYNKDKDMLYNKESCDVQDLSNKNEIEWKKMNIKDVSLIGQGLDLTVYILVDTNKCLEIVEETR